MMFKEKKDIPYQNIFLLLEAWCFQSKNRPESFR